ncbi:fibronectin type III domain-containing protein [Bacillus carboniphilus]|uniref:Fibronectin type III domain-containing protein n=1 Tax=Bacillus carboniphilus TaxID=86663 RepID=A0ABY9JY60_9BACI|nr:fibronectin type III domain-containing protein [Bacillus carboniphilus]WLR43703.1 fibronectin type III domain-containing protein [Bacillus carboniphilus]
MFKSLFTTVASGDNSDWKQPSSVEKVVIETGTGKRASNYTPGSEKSVEYIVKGTSKPSVSTQYEKVDKPTNFTPSYDEEKKTLTLSWDYDESKLENISFKLTQSVGGGTAKEITTTKQLSYTITNLEPGQKYSFTLTAVGENSESDAAATSFTAPLEEEEPSILEPIDPIDPIEEENGNEEDNNENQEDNGNNEEDDENTNNDDGNGDQEDPVEGENEESTEGAFLPINREKRLYIEDAQSL